MRKVHFIQADVFSDSPFGGNPVVVVPEAAGMSSADMQALARGMSFAETAFVLPPTLDGVAFALRCFTPTTEVAYSGHPLLGATYVMAVTGRLALTGATSQAYVQVGRERVPILVFRSGDEVTRLAITEQPARFVRVVDDLGELAAALSIDPLEILQTGLPIEVVETGLACLIVPVRALATVREMMPVPQVLDKVLRSAGGVCALVFARETLAPANDTHVRVFAPPLGITEDPATGTANGALAAYLWRHGIVRPTAGGGARLRSEQGSEIGRPSVVEIEVRSEGESLSILVGGRVARSVEGSVFF